MRTLPPCLVAGDGVSAGSCQPVIETVADRPARLPVQEACHPGTARGHAPADLRVVAGGRWRDPAFRVLRTGRVLAMTEADQAEAGRRTARRKDQRARSTYRLRRNRRAVRLRKTMGRRLTQVSLSNLGEVIRPGNSGIEYRI